MDVAGTVSMVGTGIISEHAPAHRGVILCGERIHCVPPIWRCDRGSWMPCRHGGPAVDQPAAIALRRRYPMRSPTIRISCFGCGWPPHELDPAQFDRLLPRSCATISGPSVMVVHGVPGDGGYGALAIALMTTDPTRWGEEPFLSALATVIRNTPTVGP